MLCCLLISLAFLVCASTKSSVLHRNHSVDILMVDWVCHILLPFYTATRAQQRQILSNDDDDDYSLHSWTHIFVPIIENVWFWNSHQIEVSSCKPNFLVFWYKFTFSKKIQQLNVRFKECKICLIWFSFHFCSQISYWIFNRWW